MCWLRDEDAPDDHTLARHESAHAIAAVEYDLPFDYITIDGLHSNVGEFADAWWTGSKEDDRQPLTQRYVISLAGAAMDERMNVPRLEERRKQHEATARKNTPLWMKDDEAALLVEAWESAGELVDRRIVDIEGLAAHVLENSGQLECRDVHGFLRDLRP